MIEISWRKYRTSSSSSIVGGVTPCERLHLIVIHTTSLPIGDVYEV